MTTRWVSLGTKQHRPVSLSLRRSPPESDDGEQMVPLINVVFLLMVFFLLAGSISKRDDLPITPPESTSERSRSVEALQLALLNNGTLLAGGREISLKELPEVLATQFDGVSGGGDNSVSDEPRLIQVEIRTDAGSAMGRLKPLLNALQEAGAEEVKLLTRLP